MKKKLIAVRLKHSDVELLKQLATHKEETVSEVIRDLIETGLENLIDKGFLKSKKGKK
jgi:predicted DNA-binding protein